MMLRIYMKGTSEALKGEYNFFKDFMDRRHGKAVDNVEMRMSGSVEVTAEIREKANKAITNYLKKKNGNRGDIKTK
jgi:hypothetical protein